MYNLWKLSPDEFIFRSLSSAQFIRYKGACNINLYPIHTFPNKMTIIFTPSTPRYIILYSRFFLHRPHIYIYLLHRMGKKQEVNPVYTGSRGERDRDTGSLQLPIRYRGGAEDGSSATHLSRGITTTEMNRFSAYIYIMYIHTSWWSHVSSYT